MRMQRRAVSSDFSHHLFNDDDNPGAFVSPSV